MESIPPPPPPPPTPPPPPPPPPPPLTDPSKNQTQITVKVDTWKDTRWKEIFQASNKRQIERQNLLEEMNIMFDRYYDINIQDPKKRNTKVSFAVANDVAEIKQDMWYEEDGKEVISNDVNEENAVEQVSSNERDSEYESENLTSNEKDNEEETEQCSETHFVCRSKDSETPLPINLCFPAKTTVIIVDRRKTDNGSHDFLCSLNVSKEGKQKLRLEREKEAQEELNSLPKGNIAQILNQLEKQQDAHDNEN